jgi:hypothetical protein
MFNPPINRTRAIESTSHVVADIRSEEPRLLGGDHDVLLGERGRIPITEKTLK